MRSLILYEDYTRREVHDLLDPESTFTPQAGTWGLQGIIEIPERPWDYVLFVTFGQRQAAHEFDEGITPEGVLRWQSQPQQRLVDRTIRNLIAHDEDKNSIYLFLRTGSRRDGIVAPYTYLGRLKYLVHDRDREQPVYFTWQILDWNLPEQVRDRMKLIFEGGNPVYDVGLEPPVVPSSLVVVPPPVGTKRRAGVTTSTYARRIQKDYAEQDARNRKLGLAGELSVVEAERNLLISAGRTDLAERIRHIAELEGDGAGYDIKSFTPEGEEKFIEVKTTRGNEQTAFFLSANETRFAAEHAEHYYIYRVYEFDQASQSGKLYIQNGDLLASFLLVPLLFRASPAFE